MNVIYCLLHLQVFILSLVTTFTTGSVVGVLSPLRLSSSWKEDGIVGIPGETVAVTALRKSEQATRTSTTSGPSSFNDNRSYKVMFYDDIFYKTFETLITMMPTVMETGTIKENSAVNNDRFLKQQQSRKTLKQNGEDSNNNHNVVHRHDDDEDSNNHNNSGVHHHHHDGKDSPSPHIPAPTTTTKPNSNLNFHYDDTPSTQPYSSSVVDNNNDSSVPSTTTTTFTTTPSSSLLSSWDNDNIGNVPSFRPSSKERTGDTTPISTVTIFPSPYGSIASTSNYNDSNNNDDPDVNNIPNTVEDDNSSSNNNKNNQEEASMPLIHKPIFLGAVGLLGLVMFVFIVIQYQQYQKNQQKQNIVLISDGDNNNNDRVAPLL